MGALEESIAAHAVIKTFDLQGILIAGFGRKLSTLYRSTVRASLLSGLQGTSISGSGSILLILAICGGAVLAVRGSLSVGGLVAVFDLLWFVVANLNALSKVVTPMQRASGGMTRIQEVLSAREGVADRPGARALPPFSDAIQFDNVHYGYDGAPVLEWHSADDSPRRIDPHRRPERIRQEHAARAAAPHGRPDQRRGGHRRPRSA